MGNKCIKDVVRRSKCVSSERKAGHPLLGNGSRIEDADIFQALFDAQSSEDGHLSFNKGDQIQVLSKQKDVWRGRNLSTKKEGLLVPSEKIEPYDGRKACIDVNGCQQLPDTSIHEALCDVETSEEGQLSFNKGDKIKVLSKQKVSWHGLNLRTNKEGFFIAEKVGPYDGLKEYPWYFGGIKRMRAEQLLLRMGTPGTFMIRISESVPTDFSLSLRDDDSIKHYRIKCLEKEGYYIKDKCVFADLIGLVRHYKNSKDGLSRKLGNPCPEPSSGIFGNSEINDQWETTRSRIQLSTCLGQGHFSEVWEGVWNETIPVAVKMMKHIDISKSDAEKETFLAEANIMKKLSHPKLVRLYAVCSTDEPVYIILELMSKGNLSKFLQSKEGKKLHFSDLEKMAAQISDGMKFLEGIKFIHRDLAARNILVTDKNIVKIADFGLSKFLDTTDHIIEKDDFKVARKWAAPEVIKERKFSIKSDIWSFGIVMYELASKGQVPEEVNVVKEQHFKHISNKYYIQMIKCWNTEPSERPTFQSLNLELSGS